MPVTNPSRLISIPWASSAPSGSVTDIQDADQTGITPYRASFETGSPPITLTPVGSGGHAPDGADYNGILNILTDHAKFQDIGGVPKFDAAFATIIGGYDKGAVIQSNDGTGSYISAIDNNTINFNTTPSSIGVQWKAYAGDSIAVGAPTYTEDDKWELCPIGTTMPYIEAVVGQDLSTFFATHPHWRLLHTITYLDLAHTKPGTDLQGRAMAVTGNGHNPYTSSGSDNNTLVAHTHVATDVVHSHNYKDRYVCENSSVLASRKSSTDLQIASNHTGYGMFEAFDNDNNSFLYVNDVTSAANLTIGISTAGSGNGTNGNIQRTMYLPWIIKVA